MSELSQKLLNLAAAMEHNELVNNPGNWNLLVAAAEKLNEQPNQDELWIELLRTTMTLRKKSKTDETDKYLFDIEEAKKRYRITRVK